MSEGVTTTSVNGADPGTLARIAVQRSKLRSAVTNLTTERDTIRSERDRLITENANLKTQADTGASQKRVKELEQKLRERDHRSAFDKTAKASGVPEDRLDAAWKLSDYKADGDVNEDALASTLDALKESNAFLFGESAPAKEGDAPIVKPGAGQGQGRKAKSSSNDSVIIEDDDPRWNDAAWQMTHRDQIHASTKAKQERTAREGF